MLIQQNSSQNFSDKLSSKSYIILYLATTFYVLSAIGIINISIGINLRWVSCILFLITLNLFKKQKALSIFYQPLTITFIILNFMEGINLFTNISNHIGGLLTLFFIALISFIFYNLPLPILQCILSCIYCCVIILIILSAFQGISGLTIIQLSPEIGEYIEKNNLQEEVYRFRGIFANPNSLAIYSLLVMCWVLGKILSTTSNTYHKLKVKIIRFTVFLFVGASSLYCGLATMSLQFIAGLLLVIIGVRFFFISNKLSFRRVFFEIVVLFLIYLAGQYLFDLYLMTPEQRTGARWLLFSEAFSKTDRWYLFGYGFGQNNTENLVIDIGPFKWLLELGLMSLCLIIVCILHTLINFIKLKNKKFCSHKVYMYYVFYINILVNWLFQNVIYSPLYVTTIIWILLSVMIHRMERESTSIVDKIKIYD